MSGMEVYKFRVRDKSGQLGGKEIESEVPQFNWQSFINSPNAEEFVKKSYYSAVKKIIREVHEGNKNGSSKDDLSSFEAIITRSMAVTQKDIIQWFESRSFDSVPSVRDSEELRRVLSERLPELANGINTFNESDTEALIDRFIPVVADSPSDPIADYMYSVLTLERKDKTNELLLCL